MPDTSHPVFARRRFDEPDELLEALPGVSFRITPTGSAAFSITMSSIQLDDMTLHLCHSTAFIGAAAVHAGSAVLQCPLEPGDSLTLNGAICRRGVFAAYGPGGELLRANLQPCIGSSIAFPSAAVPSLLDLPDGSSLFRSGTFVMKQAGPPVWQKVSTLIRAAVATATDRPETFGCTQARMALRDSLLCAMRTLVSDDAAGDVKVPRASAARRRIVTAAEEYLWAHRDRPIYTEELCAALATSPSALAEAFRAMLLTSPHRFLKLRRMCMVRSALRSQEAETPLVKSVALAHGFWHLGQFAHDYRATFGETPSETVARFHG